MKKVFNFLISKVFFINLLIACVIIIMVFGFTYKWLESYTNHGNTVTIPDLRGMKRNEVNNFLKDKTLKFKIADSSIYTLNKPPGSVLEQDPAPGSKAKEGRTIYLTVTKIVPPKIKMPNLIDVSYRQATDILFSYGLMAGKIIYKPDLCKNCVLAYEINGLPLKSGTEIAKGTAIDLILGDGFGKTKVEVPQLYGLTFDEAMFVLRGSALNAGAVIFDDNVRDSSQALVYKQNPIPGTELISQGEAIDIFLSQ